MKRKTTYHRDRHVCRHEKYLELPISILVNRRNIRFKYIICLWDL